MRVSVASALRAELSRARERQPEEPLALFVLGLTDQGDLPAWEMANALVPERVAGAPQRPMIVGVASLPKLVVTLFRAGELELSVALRDSNADGVPVVLLRDQLRAVKALREVEAEEVESLLRTPPVGFA